MASVVMVSGFYRIHTRNNLDHDRPQDATMHAEIYLKNITVHGLLVTKCFQM